MSELVVDCPSCGAQHVTVDILATHRIRVDHGWRGWYDAFSVCRNCNRTAVFILKLSDHSFKEDQENILGIYESVNNYFDVEGYRTLKDTVRVSAPEHVPSVIVAAFNEGATCMAVNCFNGGGTMFRLCIDHATRELLPEEDEDGLNRQVRRSLGLRVKWLLDSRHLPETLRDLSTCIREDGNDGAHAGTLTKADAEDLLDFTTILLERLYTEPERLRQAEERRNSRRNST